MEWSKQVTVETKQKPKVMGEDSFEHDCRPTSGDVWQAHMEVEYLHASAS